MTVREAIELLRIEFMILKYWGIKTKLKKQSLKMYEYAANRYERFCTSEAKEKCREIFQICKKEVGSDADGHNKGTASGIPE